MVADGFKDQTPSLRYRSRTRENTQGGDTGAVDSPPFQDRREWRKISSVGANRASNTDFTWFLAETPRGPGCVLAPRQAIAKIPDTRLELNQNRMGKNSVQT